MNSNPPPIPRRKLRARDKFILISVFTTVIIGGAWTWWPQPAHPLDIAYENYLARDYYSAAIVLRDYKPRPGEDSRLAGYCLLLNSLMASAGIAKNDPTREDIAWEIHTQTFPYFVNAITILHHPKTPTRDLLDEPPINYR